MKLGQKKKPTGTFKNHVTEFWEWFPTVARRFYDTIEADRCDDLTDEISEVAERLLPNLSWAFGPGETGCHAFTVSGEGEIDKQLLAEYWRSRAPRIPNWTFYASRQPTSPEDLAEMSIHINDQDSVNAADLMFKTKVDEEKEVVDIVAWHPAFADVPEQNQFQILFLFLDEALGEFGTQTWLGEVEIEPFENAENARSLISIPKFIEQMNNYYKWEKQPPLEAYTVYEVPHQNQHPRGDTIVGSSCIPHVIFEYIENEGMLEVNSLAGTGAEFAYIAIESSVFPEGQQMDVRANIEEALNETLVKNLCGRTLGGASGVNESYIDLLLLDGENSRQLVMKTLDDLQLEGRSRLIKIDTSI